MPGKMPPIGESVKSGNRISREEYMEMRAMMPRKRPAMPPIGDSVRSGNRVQRQEAAEDRAMAMKMKRGGHVKRPRLVSEPVMQAGIGNMAPQPAMAMKKGGTTMKGKAKNGAKAADCYKKGGMVKKPMAYKKGGMAKKGC